MALSKFYNITSNCITFCNRTLESIGSKLFKPTNVSYGVKRYHSEHNMKVLNVAEKHDAAKNIAGYLSRGTSRKVSSYVAVNILLYLFRYSL